MDEQKKQDENKQQAEEAKKNDPLNIKKSINEKIGEIIYEKAKEDVKSKIRNSIRSVKQRIRSFFSLKESKKQKINRISEEIKEKQESVIQDNVLSILELYSIHFIKSMVFLLSVGMTDEADIKSENNKNEN